jgi:Helix-turn-helix domain
MPVPVISVTQAAAALGISSKQIRRLIARGCLPGAFKVAVLKTAPYMIPTRAIQIYRNKRKQTTAP